VRTACQYTDNDTIMQRADARPRHARTTMTWTDVTTDLNPLAFKDPRFRVLVHTNWLASERLHHHLALYNLILHAQNYTNCAPLYGTGDCRKQRQPIHKRNRGSVAERTEREIRRPPRRGRHSYSEKHVSSTAASRPGWAGRRATYFNDDSRHTRHIVKIRYRVHTARRN